MMVLGAAALVAMAATAQSSILLEACNNIADSNKRLACLQELMNSRPAAITQPDSGLERVKNAFLGLQGTVSSGISYNAYSQQILEPASALGVYRASPKADAAAVGMFEAALKSYRDAQEVWRASIYDSTDAGAFGRILDVRRSGLGPLVVLYRLPVTRVLFTDHLPAHLALPVIWRQASEHTDSAMRRIVEAGNSPPAASRISEAGNDPSTAVNASPALTDSVAGVTEACKIFKEASSTTPSDPAAARPPAEHAYLRAGLKLSSSLVIQGVDKEFANSEFPVEGVLESVCKQSVSSIEQLMAVLGNLRSDQARYEATVRYHGVTLTLPFKVR